MDESSAGRSATPIDEHHARHQEPDHQRACTFNANRTDATISRYAFMVFPRAAEQGEDEK